ncbi:hypothetical protein HDV02_002450 [Globomyces sp. JEL0801]|nr:hypothetical protein HDV02_002450 [Globomyces sp. JEL0801]
MNYGWLLMPISTFADIILESQWSVSEYCEGPPNSVYVFENLDISNYGPPSEKETWTAFYEFVAYEYPMLYCGNSIIDMPKGCCFHNMDLSLSSSKSGSPTLMDDIEIDTYEKAFYATANGNNYCSITPGDGGLFHGFIDVFLLANGNCVDDYYRCSSEGKLTIYEYENCNGILHEIVLTEETAEFNDETFGSFEAKFIQFKNAEVVTEWYLDS